MGTKEININQIKLANSLMTSVSDNYFEYAYRSYFSDDIIGNIIAFIEERLMSEKETAKIFKRVSFIIIESLQNITKHQDELLSANSKNNGLFLLQKTSNTISITTSNIIRNDKIAELESRIKLVQSLSEQELKVLYKKILSQGELSDKGGAGLGLVSMARRTKGEISYRFEKLNDEYSFYYLQNRLAIKSQSDKKDKPDLFSLEKISKFQKLLANENTLMNFSGELLFDDLSNLLPIMNDIPALNNVGKDIFKLIAKLVNNITNFSDNFPEKYQNEKNKGVFILSRYKNRLYLTAGNYILNKNLALLEDKIQKINNLDEKMLTELKSSISSESNKPDTNFIEMRLINENKIFHNFSKVNDEFSFLTIQLII